MAWTHCAVQNRHPDMSTGRTLAVRRRSRSRRGRSTYICVANCTRIRHLGAKRTLPSCSRPRSIRVVTALHTRRVGICTYQRVSSCGVATTEQDQAGHRGLKCLRTHPDPNRSSPVGSPSSPPCIHPPTLVSGPSDIGRTCGCQEHIPATSPACVVPIHTRGNYESTKEQAASQPVSSRWEASVSTSVDGCFLTV